MAPEELADAGMTLDEFTDAGSIGSGPGEFTLFHEQKKQTWINIAMMLDPDIEIAGVLDDLLVNGNPAYFEGRLSRRYKSGYGAIRSDSCQHTKEEYERVGTNIPSNPRAVDNSVSREAREEMYSILENHYGGNIPEEIALEVGGSPSSNAASRLGFLKEEASLLSNTVCQKDRKALACQLTVL